MVPEPMAGVPYNVLLACGSLLGSRVVSKANLGGGETVLLATIALPFKMAWPLCWSPTHLGNVNILNKSFLNLVFKMLMKCY